MIMNNLIKVLKTSKILIPVFIISLFLGIFLFFYIPKTMEDGIIKNIVEHSKNSVERLQMEREYYTEAVVDDVKKYAPNLSFDYEHKGIDGKIPFPTTTVHDLSEMYSQRSKVKFYLYSNYPFLNRKERVLTAFQKKAISEVEKAEDGMFYQKDIIDGKEVLRVAIADYMVLPGCVSCHNTHKLKDWEFDWKLGDKRGVLEIVTPMDIALGDMKKARNKIVVTSLGLMILLVIYYAFILLRRENELYEENKELSVNLEVLFEDFGKYVISSKTDLKGIIIYASRKFCEISGYKEEELIGSNHNIIRHLDTPKETFKNMWTNIKENKTWTGEVKNRKKNGEFYWTYAVISPLYNNEGLKIGYSSIRHNITDKKKIEEFNLTLEQKVVEEVEKNRQKDQQILEQSRLAQMGEMISMIAHQWRQPLSAISSTSAGINLKAKLNKLDNDVAIDLSDKISQYSQHLSLTIDDFREFFKSNKEKKDTTYDNLIKSVLNIVESSIINQNINLIKKLNSKDTLHTYENEVKQVVLNLIKNAEDILLEKEIKNPQITIETQNNILTISDNAGGISEDIMDKIFDPYFSTKIKKDGTGLGLYMSKTIIEEHCGGKLSVSNDTDGAVFKITLGVNNG